MEVSYRILLVEDSRTQAARFERLFTKEGWDVICAVTAEEALELLGRARPDLIVIDYYLPGMKGDEFCREIRMNVNTRGIPVLMLTVGGTQDAETRGLESGADDYLSKSADPDILLLRTRALLRKSRSAPALLEHGGKFSGRAKLLAIDDSPTYLEYLAHEMSSESYTVEKAATAEEGLARLERETFDCVLVDLELPGLNGIEVCRRIAEVGRASQSPVITIVVTGHDDKENMTRSLEAGADDFIGKSADISVLKARIRALLRRKFVMEENRRLFEEFKNMELEAIRARAEKEAAEVRATMAEKLAKSNRELERANRRLREALEVTRAITENAAEALFLADAAGRVTFVNPAAEHMFGYSRQELLGQPLHDKIHRNPRDGSPVPIEDCPVAESLKTGVTLTGLEAQFMCKDGSVVDVAWSSAPVLEKGSVIAAVIVVHDISERKRAEEKLRQAQRLESIGLLAGGVAHDFNNILTGIMGNASLIEQDVPPETAERIRAVIDGAEKAANLTRQLLAYSGKGQFIIEQLDLSELVRDMAGLVRLSVPKSVELLYDLCDGLPLISADPGQMQQIIMNLVINAGEAIGPERNGTVRISTGVEEVAAPFTDAAGAQVAPGCYVSLQVKDTGCGMDEQTRAKIFEPFYTTKFTGRGLGLAAVSGIVRSQKGAILVESAPGAGSVFRVLLPATRSANERPDAFVEARQPKVLVVDDEQSVRDFLKAALEHHGYSVLVAHDGSDGMELWRKHRGEIALVLLDLVMPIAGGRQMLAEIKSLDPNARVLLTSGYNEEEAKRLCASYVGTAFIQKPYTARTVLQRVQEAIAARAGSRC
jgi:PAS domain S-box-containing protein